MISKSSHKNILYVTRPLCPPWDEASKNFAYNLAKNIQQSNVHIMTCAELPNMPDTVKQHHIYSQSNFTFSQKIRSLIYQKYHTRDHDIAHYFFTPTKRNTKFAKKFLKDAPTKSIQTIATLRDDILSDREIKKLIFGDYVVTYTKYAKQKLEALGFRNVIEISPGIDLDNFKPTSKDIRTLQQLDIMRSEYIVTFVGEYNRLGGSDHITDMLIEYFKVYPGSPMHFIYGCRVKKEHGDERKKLETIERLRNASILDKVTFTDTFTEMSKLYNTSDVILFPVKDLNGKFDIPLVIPEAMACEKPIILSDIPKLTEFTHTNFSVTVPFGNPKALIDAIEKLRNDEHNRILIGKRARDHVLNRFSIKRVAEKYSKLYKNIKYKNIDS